MNIPYIPLYIDDYEGHTAHLTLEEDGVYFRLIRLCWRTSGCSIPNDPKWIKRMMRVSDDDYSHKIKPIIQEFFTIKKGRVFQKRLQQEYEKINEKLLARSEAGKKGGEAKALKNNKNNSSKATVLPVANGKQKPSNQNQNQNHIIKEKIYKKNGSRISKDWKPSTDLANQISLKEKTNINWVDEQVYSFVNYWIAKSGKDATKLDWDATFRNWCAKSYNKPEPSKHMETAADWGMEETDEIVCTKIDFTKDL